MASHEKISINDAVAAMESAYARLAAATDIAVHERAQSAAQREAMQQEISLSWQATASELETALSQAQSENEHLKSETARLSNQLATLQRDYLELQQTAGDVVARLDDTVVRIDTMLEVA